MAHGDIQIHRRLFDFFFDDITFSIVRFYDYRLCHFLCFIGNLVHLPEDVFEKLLLLIVHRSNLLGIIRIRGSLYGIDREDFRPYSTGARHFKFIIGVIDLDAVKL